VRANSVALEGATTWLLSANNPKRRLKNRKYLLYDEQIYGQQNMFMTSKI
jgi:hypothetical protein